MELTELYYFHALINRKYFNNELEPVIIREFESEDYDEDDITAKVETCLEPFVIWFNKEHLEENDELFTITVLFHEMIHQYCTQNGIDDVTPDGTHLEDFVIVASDHGMTHNGYGLSEDVEKFLKTYIDRYNQFQEFSFI